MPEPNIYKRPRLGAIFKTKKIKITKTMTGGNCKMMFLGNAVGFQHNVRVMKKF